MRSRLFLLAALLLGLSGTAQARLTAGHALLRAGAQFAKVADVAQPPCPAGVPVQAITVVNDANVRPLVLAKVERAVVDQSMQLRVAWGTPCVQFGPGGWPLRIVTTPPIFCGPDTLGCHGETGVFGSTPSAFVATFGVPSRDTSITVSHEIMEMLVDPTGGSYIGSQVEEVCDPVADVGYALDGVTVSDFVTPAWFVAGSRGPWDHRRMVESPLTYGFEQATRPVGGGNVATGSG